MVNYMDVVALLALVALTTGGQAQPLGRLVTHVGVCEPREAISRNNVPDKWQAIPFEIAEGKAFMITCPPGKDAPPITVEPGVTGWHKVYLGAYYHEFTGRIMDRAIAVRLTGEEDYTRVDRPTTVGIGIEQMAESFWGAVDLTGRKLELTRPVEVEQACLAYVRLVPMTVEDVAAWHAGDTLPDTVGFARPISLLKLDSYPTDREWFRTTVG